MTKRKNQETQKKMNRVKFSSPDFLDLAEMGSMAIFEGVVWSFNLKILKDGNGAPLEVPRSIVIKAEVFSSDV